jgi:alpha-amylase/alpha-mannosidase (GH57 family)
MHQPDYRDPEGETALLPWVRLHGVKDYLDMVTILDDFPGIRQNFNLVPSLLDQLQEYVTGRLSDRILELSRKEATALDEAERAEILESFFHLHWDNLVKPYPRYWELLKKRGFHPPPAALLEIQRYFSGPELLDLQVWYNLAWIDPVWQREYELPARLLGKGRNFSEAEKLELLELQRQICARIIPAYRERAAAGRIELSTTPYYHPILPLLCDTGLARISRPQDQQPELRFAHPEDARAQIEKAIARHTELFGLRPQGMWPAEGAVCQQLVPIFAAAGIRWIATDEAILANSAAAGSSAGDDPAGPTARFRAWRAEAEKSRIEVLFRDHQLSDLIGFVYSHWNEQQAADDFIQRLLRIKRTLGGRAGENAVAIILDGENAWEHYHADGAPFLRELYARLQESPELESTTVSGYLESRREPPPRLREIYPGSWIDGNFRIWIGHPEENRAWELLGRARRDLRLAEQQAATGAGRKADEKLKQNFNKAWEHLYKAEGSDWFWWYGDDHGSENDADFDELFRRHLIAVYRHSGQKPPEILYQPIIQSERVLYPVNEITGFIEPRINGEIGGYYDWQGAARCEVAGSGGAMHRTEYLARELYYGFNQEFFFLRLDLSRETMFNEKSFPEIHLLTSPGASFSCRIEPAAATGSNPETNAPDTAGPPLILKFIPRSSAGKPPDNQAQATEQKERENRLKARNESDKSRKEGSDGGLQREIGSLRENESHRKLGFAVGTVLTLKIAFALLRLEPGQELNFAVAIRQQGMEVQRIPAGGYYHLTVPDADFEARMWYV